MKLGDLVKEYRRANSLSQRDLAKAAGLTSGYISMLENDRNPGTGAPIAPTARTLDKLARAMGMSFGDLTRAADLSLEDPPAEGLSPAAERAGRLYDLASDKDRRLVDSVLAPYDAAAPEGKLLPFAGGEYFRHRGDDGFDEVDVFDEAAAAGLGNYLGAPASHTEQYPPGVVPRGTDFGVRISGDSMEPAIHSGCTAFVQASHAIEPGETGIFVLNGQSYCKRLAVDLAAREVRLRSNNPAYADIVISDADELRTLGRVLGCW